MSSPSTTSEPRRGTLILLFLAGVGGLLVVTAAIGLARGTEPSADSPYRGSEPPARFELPPFELTSYRGAPVASPSLDYLLGSEQELRPLWDALQILPSLDSGQDSVHSAPLRIYDTNGVWAATQHAGVDLTEQNLLHDIRAALAAGHQTAG